ncbi:AI-2E family transporter [Candidatus Woesearchaeota archaeon]|nr:AI-2E family transporter [Candidatus Woesearchaeota archaeon]
MASPVNKRRIQMIFAAASTLILLFIIIKGLWQYIGAFFGVAILYVLFRKLNTFLRDKTFLGRKGAALITIIASVLVVVIPSFLLISAAASQLSGTLSDPQVITDAVDDLNAKLPWIDLVGTLSDQVPRIAEFIANALISSFSNITRSAIALAITYFLLYFILIEDEQKLKKGARDLIPFSKKNAEKLLEDFKRITNATLITSGLMALLQGFLLAILFVIFGIRAAVFWGLLGAFLSFIPIVGPALIWVPVAIIKLAQGHIAPAIIIAAGGLLIAYVDNLLRPYLNRKIGRINQVVSLLGIFMGLAVFGIIGVIIGPIIISSFLLTIKMFKEEYLD